MIPRLLITQPKHAQKWTIGLGKFALVNRDGEVKELGNCLHASVLATRRTVIRVKEWYSKEPALETCHDPVSPHYKELEQLADNGGPAAEGPELLLYIHETEGVATYLLASIVAKREWACFSHYFHPSSSHVLRLRVRQEAKHYVPSMMLSGLMWNQTARRSALEAIQPEINQFKTAKGSTLKDVLKGRLRHLGIPDDTMRRFLELLLEARGAGLSYHEFLESGVLE